MVDSVERPVKACPKIRLMRIHPDHWEGRRSQLIRSYLDTRMFAVGGVCIAWFVLSLDSFWRHFPHPLAVALLAFGLAAIAAGMMYLERLNRRQEEIGGIWVVALFALVVVVFAVLYPLSLRHTISNGSDREDALRLAIQAVRDHAYPYSRVTYLGNPITPLPGALLIATPFFLIGHIAWQNLFWGAVLFFLCVRFFRYRATALFFLLVFLLLAPADLGDFTAGGDYIINLVYIFAAVAFCLWSYQRSLAVVASAGLILGITISSRALYVPVLIPLLAASLQRSTWRRTLLLFSLAVAAAAMITLPVFSPHPIHRLFLQVHQQSAKLHSLPPILHAENTLPALALLAASVAFFTRMTFSKVLLLFSVSVTTILAPPILGSVVAAGQPVYGIGYLAVGVLPFVLWTLGRYEVLLTHKTERTDAQLERVA